MESFKDLIDEAPDGVVMLEAGRIVYLNATAARLLGVDAGQAIGRPIASFLPPVDAARAGERIGRLMATGQEVTPADYGTLADPGRIVEIKAKRWQWQGRPAVLAFARDVTERRALEQQLVRADRLAAIGTLAASVAHEVNNPLTYVQLSLHRIEAALARMPDAAAAVEHNLRDIHHGIDRVAAITRTLRAFARPHDIAPAPIDVTGVVENALKMVDNDLRHRARLVRRFGEVPWVIANETRLEQVIVNLLLNAIQSLSGREDDTITVEVSPRGATEVAIAVRDTGCGMAPAVLDRMFEPFFTTKPIGDGMGLGLVVSRTIVEAFGGSIYAESTEGEGTTITVVLRAHDRRLDADAPATRSQPSPGRARTTRRRILIVDDEDLVRKLLAELVGTEHDVVTVDGGPAALAALDGTEFDVVLCDVMMPGMTGADVYRHAIAKRPALARQFVFMSGGAFTQEVQEFLETTGRVVLGKPFQVDAVLDAISATSDPTTNG